MFFSNSTALYSADRRARCIAARLAHTDAHHFFIGTLSLREPNEVQLLKFDEDSSELVKARSFAHPHEVWSIAPSPEDADVLATTFNDGGSYGAALWQLPADGGDGGVEEMEQLQTFPCDAAARGNVQRMLWDPFTADEEDAQIAAVHDSGIAIWKLGAIGDAPFAQLRFGSDAAPIGAAAWDPHHPNELTAASGGGIYSYDLRAVRRAARGGAADIDAAVHSIPTAHSSPIHDIDYNPNKPWNLVSAGDDSFIKVRRALSPRHRPSRRGLTPLSLPLSPSLPSSGTFEKQRRQSKSSRGTPTG